MSKILIIDDEEKITKLLTERIAAGGYEVESFSKAEDALPVIMRGDADIVLCDLKLSGMDGLGLLRKTKEASPSTDFVIMTAYASASTAVEAMRAGAYEYLIKPFQMDEVILLLKQIQDRRDLVSENLVLKQKISQSSTGRSIVGASDAIQTVRDMISKVSRTQAPVLVQGESGTGKELVANEIHMSSPRARSPFIVINCAAVPAELLEAELFGFERGAFTGAVRKKPGMFKLADSGSLFLDEIGELPLSLQAKILRAIENGELHPLGSSTSINVDVRIIAATNRRLEESVRDGLFRSDLFYRLNVFPINIPPLRARREDIIPITNSFLGDWKIPPDKLSEEASEKLVNYSWPGNVRELRNILERAMILAGPGTITPEHITISAPDLSATPEDMLRSIIGEKSLHEVEEVLVRLSLEKAGGNKSEAARMLGITRRSLYGLLKRLEKEDGDINSG